MGVFNNLSRNVNALSNARSARTLRQISKTMNDQVEAKAKAERDRRSAIRRADQEAREADLKAQMAAEVRNLLGSGLVQDYYDQAAGPFVRAALRFAADESARRAA